MIFFFFSFCFESSRNFGRTPKIHAAFYLFKVRYYFLNRTRRSLELVISTGSGPSILRGLPAFFSCHFY